MAGFPVMCLLLRGAPPRDCLVAGFLTTTGAFSPSLSVLSELFLAMAAVFFWLALVCLAGFFFGGGAVFFRVTSESESELLSDLLVEELELVESSLDTLELRVTLGLGVGLGAGAFFWALVLFAEAAVGLALGGAFLVCFCGVGFGGLWGLLVLPAFFLLEGWLSDSEALLPLKMFLYLVLAA